MEDNDLIHPVQELGAEVLTQDFTHTALDFLVNARDIQDILAAQVAGHNDHRVAEIDRAPLAIGQPSIIEHL